MPQYSDIPAGFSPVAQQQYSDVPPGFSVAEQQQPKTQTEGAFRRFMAREAQGLKRGAQLSGNIVAQAVGALPLMAADFGVAVRNLGENVIAGDPPFELDRELPSQMYRRGLEGIGATTTPKGFAENAVNLVGQAVVGSRLPVPSVAKPAPANFVPARQQALEAANRAGYVVPPATARPDSVLAGFAEGAAGKLTTAQRAASANQSVTNRLAAQAVGMADDGTVTREGLETIRAEAGAAHEALRNFGREIASDTEYRVGISEAVRSIESAANKFPALVSDKILKVSQQLAQPRFSADEAVGAIRLLRGEADTAYRAGNGELGKAYRSLSNTFEGLVERNLARSGEGTELLENFRNARELIAKTYSIQNAMRGENVDAQALGRALDRGKYLSGTLRQIAQFAQRFPKAARVTPATESLPPYSPIDIWTMAASGAAGAASGHPAAFLPMAYSAGRPLLRNFLLSPAGQSALVNGVPQNALQATAGALPPVVNALRQ